MRIGVPKEIKIQEYRVGLTPGAVRELTQHGHQVMVEHLAGTGIGYDDDAYRAAGASIAETAVPIFETAELIVKVKEPQPTEIDRLRRGQILFTYLHLAADRAQTEGLIRSGATCIAYETVTDRFGALPLLAPMSEVAGRMAIQVGAHCLEREQGGIGILLGGVPGVPPAKVVVLGGGVSGTNAARMAAGLEASVTIIDKSIPRLKELDLQFGARATTLFATTEAIEHSVMTADLVIGAVLVPGAAAPKLVTREMVRKMPPGSVLGVVHYCVTNMPGAVPRTSTYALTNATLPFVLALAQKGWRRAMLDDPHLREGLNIHDRRVTHPAVAHAFGMHHFGAAQVLVGDSGAGGGL